MARLSLRLRRQEVLERDRPPLYEAVIHEAALRMQFGGAKVTRAQLDHILGQSERDRTTVRVIPFAAGGFPGAGQSFTHVGAADHLLRSPTGRPSPLCACAPRTPTVRSPSPPGPGPAFPPSEALPHSRPDPLYIRLTCTYDIEYPVIARAGLAPALPPL
ncbi:Scr1 family TA system antitoxin-like transcriptional regulator [Streptomyces laculatispora]|uniref:Scr1 family TA system antitoxin-like transcriptional regulator n=1 Tax=Streptomyces laculatispora TaxID=887464 RepID=A0ABY9HXM0_9ACTN|nr:Scr1 family TA system antitoxin-like transcriptional regulator [Streptomyces laculatispora]WLQ39323.1 Scr1 family TA system antitoxin-like transcriptional regulator [Streptomyces laculatispora]